MEQDTQNTSAVEKVYIRVNSGEGMTTAESGIKPEAIVHRFESSRSDFHDQGYLLKRSFDVLVSFVVLAFSLPLLGIIALAIRFGSRGPVFHNVFRTGMGFKVFKLYGFRTTKAGARRMEENLFHLKGPASPVDQIAPAPTTLGRTLRAVGLDMLPMFYNVLRGDISLVGTRALPLHEATLLVRDATSARFLVPAGIWGPWGRNDMRSGHKLEMDILDQELKYAEERTFLYDLRILGGNAHRGWTAHPYQMSAAGPTVAIS
jgi:lipopolysaccharide/colanic/teichoic acid biosynthesis glycosyltransferase